MSVKISIVIPAHNAAAHLDACLRHIFQSGCTPHEVVVVDDGSQDDTALVARRHGAIVLDTGGKSGPARARNLGAARATGNVLFFLDADVCVATDTIERVEASFASDPSLDALIGSYDDSPGSEDFLSQYRNLMHCFVHQTARHDACTFWSGCGAIRREVFIRHSGFDENYRRPAIEDIELGYRMKRAGAKMLLDPAIRVKHLKRWSFWNLVKCDILDRGIPWTELILRDRSMPNDLNLQISQRISVSLAILCVAVSAAIAIHYGGYFLTPLFALVFFLLAGYWVDSIATRSRGAIATMICAFLVIIALAWWYHMMTIIPLLATGLVLLLVKHRYAYESGRMVARIPAVLFAGLFVIYALTLFPAKAVVGVPFLILLLIVILNNQFYLFLAQKKGWAFAVAAVPFHILYHFYNGISFAAGTIRWFLGSAGQRRRAIGLGGESR